MLSKEDQSKLIATITQVMREEAAVRLHSWLLFFKLPEALSRGAIAANFTSCEEVADELIVLSDFALKLADALRRS